MPRDDEIEQLLAGGHLSGAQYDRIEARVMERTAVSAPVRSTRRWLTVLPAGLAAAAALALYVGLAPPSVAPAGEFRAKGPVETTTLGAVELACSSGERPCKLGDTLIFTVNTALASGYLNARAQRTEPPSGEPIRLFPSEAGHSPYVAPGAGTVVVPEGIRLRLHGAGLYRLSVWFSQGAPAREAGGADSSPAVELWLKVSE